MEKLVEPEKVGLGSERLQRVAHWLDEQIAQERLSGASVLVGRRGSPAYFAATGHADKDAATPFRRDTIVRIFSMTKPITTVAAMMLYERGCFQLDDPISKYLPEFGQVRVWKGGATSLDDAEPAKSPITVRQIMTHTSGLTYGFMNTNVVDQAYRDRKLDFTVPGSTLEGWSKEIAEIPLIAEPGSQWNYSVSTDVLGRLVEVWSGQALDVFFQREIFEPLGMTDTGFAVPEGKWGRFASLYSPERGGGMASVGAGGNEVPAEERGGLSLLSGGVEPRYREGFTALSGGGGLVGSIDDYARFCQMLLNGGRLGSERLLSPVTVAYMRKNQLPDNRDMAAMGQPVWSETSYEGIGFGLGGAVILDPVKAHVIASPGEYHWGGAASTFFWVDPTEDLYAVFFTQLIPSSTYPLRRELRTRVYQAVID